MIHTIFADAGPSAPQLGSQVQSIAFWISIAANLALVLALFIKPKISPQPLEVKAVGDLATKHEVERLTELNRIEHGQFDVRIGGVDRSAKKHLDEAIEKLRAERREDMQSLHKEINDVGKKVAALDTETQNQNAWLERMDEKLDKVIAKKS